MTREELEKEAEEWIKDHSGLIGSYKFVKYDYDSLKQAYLTAAEPREKQIAHLEKSLIDVSEKSAKRINELEKNS